MAWELVAEGTGSDINNVVSYENSVVEEGQKARLQCDCYVNVSSWQIDDIRNALTWAGVEELQIVGSGSTINVYWRKGFPWAAVVILALVAVIAVAAWAFFKDVPVPITSALMIGVALLAGVLAINIIGKNFTGGKSYET